MLFYLFQTDKIYLSHTVQRQSAVISVYVVIYIDLMIIHFVLLYLTFTDDIKCDKTDISTFREYPLQMLNSILPFPYINPEHGQLISCKI